MKIEIENCLIMITVTGKAYNRQSYVSLWKSNETTHLQLLHTWKTGKESYFKPDNIIIVVENRLSIYRWQISYFLFFYCFKHFIISQLINNQQLPLHFLPKNVLYYLYQPHNLQHLLKLFSSPCLHPKRHVFLFFSCFVAILKFVLVKK